MVGPPGELEPVATSAGYRGGRLVRVVAASRVAPSANPMGVEWFGLAMGLGFVLSFGYWCTDFLVVQRAMAAESMNAARRTPLLAAVPKMLFPLLVILPGMIAIALHYAARRPRCPSGRTERRTTTSRCRCCWRTTSRSGLLGLGLTALMASFMSGMAGNVTAFNTVWTYDIYQSYVKPGQSDRHYLRMGHAATVFGILLSVAAAYAATRFNNIMDMLQLVFAFVNAPLFATFLLGMFWRRATGHGAFFGLLTGTLPRRFTTGSRCPRAPCRASRAPSWGRAPHLPQRDGAELLDRDHRVDRLLRGDDRDLAPDQAHKSDDDLRDWSTL